MHSNGFHSLKVPSGDPGHDETVKLISESVFCLIEASNPGTLKYRVLILVEALEVDLMGRIEMEGKEYH